MLRCLAMLMTVSALACGGAETAVSPESAAQEGDAESAPTATPIRGPERVEAPHWSYSGGDGPDRWGSLGTEYATCDEGREQSPINISQTESGTGQSTRRLYVMASVEIELVGQPANALDNGHTIQVNLAGGSQLDLDGKVFTLVQFHFHIPSEHTLEGRSFPGELHFVHAAADGKLAVAAAWIVEGAANEALAAIFEDLPDAPGQSVHVDETEHSLEELLPSAETAYFYTGSLTTPPCTEGVRWLVATVPIELSAAQLQELASRIADNNRPIQPRNGREIATGEVR